MTGRMERVENLGDQRGGYQASRGRASPPQRGASASNRRGPPPRPRIGPVPLGRRDGPVYNDLEALNQFLPQLDSVLAERYCSTKLLVVDDYSQPRIEASAVGGTFRAIRLVEVVRLRRNVGHQRAIAVGLLRALESDRFRWAVVMDSDGEDRAEDVPRLLEAIQSHPRSTVVFAERTRRTESLLFLILYFLYRKTHHVLTGIPVRVGNFSALTPEAVNSLAAVSDLWNHYAAAVVSASIPHSRIPTQRGVRLVGRSKMRFVSLVSHGLRAISVFTPVISVRLLIAIALLLSVSLLALAGPVLLPALTTQTLPSWVVPTTLVTSALLINLLFFVILFVFSGLNRLNSIGDTPISQYRFLIDTLTRAEH